MLEFFYPYLMGLISIASPCTFIIVPVLLSETRLRYIRVMKFVIGTTITFSILGAIAAITGRLLTSFIGSWLFIITGIITLIAGLNMAGKINLHLPYLFPKKSHSNSFVMGLLFGGVSLSCIGAPLGAVLVFIATNPSIIYGILMMVIFSLGVATPFFVLGLVLSNEKISKRIIKKRIILQKIGSVILLIVSLYLFIVGIRGIMYG